MAQDLASRAGVTFDESTTQADLLWKLNREIRLDPQICELFHTLRIEGNKATHQFQTQHREAIDGLKVARVLAIWYHRSFGKQGSGFKPGTFTSPQDPSHQLQALQAEIEQLKGQLTDSNQQLESSQQLASLISQEKEEYEALAIQMDEEARTYSQVAEQAEAELEVQKKAFEVQLKELQEQAASKLVNVQEVIAETQKASKDFSLNEELTRILIDQQLIDAGWEADTKNLTHKLGARPEKGKNKAIAEWPMPNPHTGGLQRADYVLFAGLIPIAVVEAKRENKNVAGKIGQAERYAAGFTQSTSMTAAWEEEGRTIAWPHGDTGHFQIPFVYSCNGRPYIKQLAEQSGTWFRDVRDPAHLAKPLQGFHTPDGLLDRLKRSREAAEATLKAEGFDYLRLRKYQIKAIQAVEKNLEEGKRDCLLAMATGTGKTRTIIGLMYRFLKAERFKRILFLVDRNALGQQAVDAFNDAPLEQNQTLSKIYNVAELGDMAAEAETRIQVATVQAMVRRVFQSEAPPNVDAFDCIIVDEAHRGYTLDQEMTEGELEIRDQSQYLSSYRRVLDYFDAVKIGMTATPAKQTTEIFGKPVYTYSYREAVADDWLIDHEPPIRYETLLTQKGIKFEKGESVSVINTQTGEVDSADLEDEMNFDVEAFNRRVITESFNEVICEELAKELDPTGDEKVMVFCATDLHADMVKRLLDEAFKNVWDEEYNEAAVRKITGASDKVDELIRRYKNERYPSIAITVDLLTTGIDVPPICHLVFLRRVKSRILYEQMIGRATRRCDEIGKTVFKIYDPVDIYATLQAVSTMKPLVKDPDITVEQLIRELLDPKSLEAPGSTDDRTHADDVLSALSQKLMRVLRKANKRVDDRPDIKQKMTELEQLWGVEPGKLHQHLRELGPRQAGEFVKTHKNLVQQLAEVNRLLGTERYPIISNHKDQLMVREQSYGEYKKPEDYLESFNTFVRDQVNQSAALSVVVNRPRDLTREQLKEVRLLLDQNGFNEAKLKTAWRSQSNQDIAASIIGYIRQAALGEALIPFEERVSRAMEGIYASHSWNPVQRKWLERLAKQLGFEVIIDRHFVNNRFADKGGAKQLDKILGNHLDEVLDQLAGTIWSQSA
ncbi:MAG: type I restriction-modification system endonuclease [Chromatiales bacterium]|nr:type I restriction-modification system endonuclease [Chromatiales bacterium]